MIHVTALSKKSSIDSYLEPEDFSDKILNDWKKANLVWIDLHFPEDFDEDPTQFNRETEIGENFLQLERFTIRKYLEKSYRPAIASEYSTTIITLPYFSAIKHVKPLDAEKSRFVPIQTATDHFIIFFQKPNRIVSVRTDPKNFSFECVSIVSKWMQQVDMSSNILDKVIVRLMDEIVDDNVELIRRFRMNVEFLEQDIIRKTIRTGIIEEVLKLKSISMFLFSYILSEKRFFTRLQSSSIPNLTLTEDVASLVNITINEIDSQMVIANDINRVISDILNLYSLMLQDRLNDVLRIFTVFSVMLILPTFIVGFFGMNNFGLAAFNPLFTGLIFVILCISIIVPLILLWRFRLLKKIRL